MSSRHRDWGSVACHYYASLPSQRNRNLLLEVLTMHTKQVIKLTISNHLPPRPCIFVALCTLACKCIPRVSAAKQGRRNNVAKNKTQNA